MDRLPPRVVVSTLDPPPSWDLPAAQPGPSAPWMSGGQQALHEIAVAAAVAGYDVELRGEFSPALLDRMEAATGVRPATPTSTRRPTEIDLIVVSEGGHDPLRFARYVLSPARVALALLAAPGLFGWPFDGAPEHHDPLTVEVEELTRPQPFRAMAALGIDIITPMPFAAELAAREGARVHLIGKGSPLPALGPAALKDIAVAFVEGSRWRALAEQVAESLPMPAHRISIGPHEDVLAQIARSRVLLWPSRVEGDGRVLWEARAAGTVVVALSSNPYAVGLDEDCGAIAVDTIEEMAPVIEHLLADDEWRATLSAAGRRTALEQGHWPRFVARVDRAIAAINDRPNDPQADAFAWFGRRVDELLRAQA